MSTSNPAGPRAPVETPVLLEAINLTLRTVERRGHLYRNLVIVVSLTALASLILVVVLRRWIVLTGFIGLPVSVGIYLILDHRMVESWRGSVVQMRDQRGLNLGQFARTLTGLRHLPQSTLRAMLDTLNVEKAGA